MKKDIIKDSIYRCMLLVQIILFAGAIYMDRTFAFNRLSSGQIINVTIDLVAMFVLIILFASCILGRRNDSTFSFLALAFCVCVCLFFDNGSWIVDRISRLRIANYIFNIGNNCIIILICGLFYLFACKSLKLDLRKYMKASVSIIVMIILGVVAEFLNIFFGYYYYIDRYGVYARNPHGSLAGYIPFVYILGVTSYMVIRQEITLKLKGIYLLYILVPFLISIWYMVTELPPTFFSSTFISVLLIYTNIYIGLGREATQYELDNAHKETELALQRNKQTLSQIRPHFIFNALGSIEELCVIEPQKAESAVHYFAKYLRANMDALGETDMVSFGTELEHIHNYIWLEKMRFDDELEYIEEIQVDDFLIPTLSLQPLVENAVKHGMMGKEEGILHVKIKTYAKDNNYVIEISDDGCGFDTSQRKDDGRSHIGMTYAKTSVENRLGGTISIDSVIGKGTMVSIVIPHI